jgi:hypothetical protein
LKIDSVDLEGESASIHFSAVAGRAYSLLFRADLSTGTWLKLADIPRRAQSGPVTVNDPTFGAATMRFYQLVVP